MLVGYMRVSTEGDRRLLRLEELIEKIARGLGVEVP